MQKKESQKISERPSKTCSENHVVYERFYKNHKSFFGQAPSPILYKLIQTMPPKKSVKVLDIGCGEGRNAIFLARNGYQVTALDVSPTGLQKTQTWARQLGLSVQTVLADIRKLQLTGKFDMVISTWTMQFLPSRIRRQVVQQVKRHTKPNGINAFSVFVKKPYIAVPRHERHTHPWVSGELFSYYWDWQIEFCREEVFDCRCGGAPHKHAANSMIARKRIGS